MLATRWTLAQTRVAVTAELALAYVEQRAGAAVCVIGAMVRRELFGSADPVGSSLRVRQFSCEVIGLLASKGQGGFGQDQDDIIVMPIHTVQRRLTGNTNVGTLKISVARGRGLGPGAARHRRAAA